MNKNTILVEIMLAYTICCVISKFIRGSELRFLSFACPFFYGALRQIAGSDLPNKLFAKSEL